MASCSGGSSTAEAAVAVETYIQALADRDLHSITNTVCLAWGEQAHLEFASFSAVTTKVEGLDCQVTSNEGDYALVKCQGVLITNDGEEDQEIQLQVNHYHTLFEKGKWRMCGYH
jgi:hypothetical protein